MNTNNEAPFPSLRTAYLRAIARAWRDERYLKELVEASNDPRGALGKLEKDFHFKFPFHVKFAIDITTRPVWQPVGTTGWFGFPDRFEVWLPSSPAKVEERATVLARYCAEFPSLLGKGELDAQAPADFAEVGVITSRVLALSWSDKAFAQELFRVDDARGLFQDAMDCMVPWNFKLKFHRTPEEGSDEDAYWRRFPRSKIVVHLPQKPAVDVQAIALAAYNDTGGQYPFTCG